MDIDLLIDYVIRNLLKLSDVSIVPSGPCNLYNVRMEIRKTIVHGFNGRKKIIYIHVDIDYCGCQFLSELIPFFGFEKALQCLV